MPTIEINLKDLENLVGKKIEDVEELLSYAKVEVEEKNGDYLKIEVKDTNRPDLWSVEGIARLLKGILDVEKGIPNYKVEKSNLKVFVDKNVENVRKYIACAIVKDVKLGRYGFESLIQLQEKVMITFGRNRKKVAIGTHNFDLIKFPVYYKAVKPEEISFVPLNESEKMNLKEILEKTETGRKYGYILKDKELYPILIDSNNEVLSFPPIINSNYIGRIDENTRNIFIDVTGTDLESVLIALNVIVTSLADRGGKIYSVKIVYPDKEIETPILIPKELELDIEYFNKISGLNLDKNKIIDLLKKCRFDAKGNGNKIIVKYLPYRADIISQQDIVEDILIAYGLNKIEPEKLEIYTVGKENEIKKFIDLLREIMVSLGAIEVYTNVLTSKELLDLFGLKNYIEVENPVSSKYNVVRTSILPNLLELLSHNKGLELPIEIFEIGEVAEYDSEIYETYKLCYVIVDKRLTVNDPKRKLLTILKNLGIEYKIEKAEIPYCIKGRAGKIVINGKEIGYFGEIHPEIIVKLGMCNPVGFFELDIKRLYYIYQSEIKKK